jgi:hypothetical protein
MFQVTLVYNIDTPNGPRRKTYTDTWVIKTTDEDTAVHEAQYNTEMAVYATYGWSKNVQVVYEEITVRPLEECGTCGGRGHLASMEGFYRCPTCQGKKYFVVEYADQG